MVCNLFNDEATTSRVEVALKLPNFHIFLINCIHVDSAFIRKLSLAFTVIYKQSNKIISNSFLSIGSYVNTKIRLSVHWNCVHAPFKDKIGNDTKQQECYELALSTFLFFLI